MGDLRIVFARSTQEIRWKSAIESAQDVLIGAASKATIGQSQHATFALNALEIRKVEWWYGFAERIDDCSKDEVAFTEVLFDCIELLHTEQTAPQFAPFYPPGVDSLPDDSVDFVYRATLDAKNTANDLKRLDPESVNKHIKVVETLLQESKQCVVRVTVPRNGPVFTDGRWYILAIDPVNAGSGTGAHRFRYPAAFQGEGAEAITVADFFTVDDETERRLRRLVSLDFVSDLDIDPPIGSPVDPPPVLVLMPGGNEVPEGWAGWELAIADYGPLFWDERPAQITLESLPEIEEPPRPQQQQQQQVVVEPQVLRKPPKKRKEKREKQSLKVYVDPEFREPTASSSTSTETKSTKVAKGGSGQPRKPLATLHPNIRNSPEAKKNKTRIRFTGQVPSFKID